MIQISGVRFRYPDGDFELSVRELRVGRGERVAIVGPSGSGKTTLLHLAAGIVAPERGSVVTDGVEVGRLDDARRRSFRVRHIGYVFQAFELLDYLDVLDNVLLPFRINPVLSLDAAAIRRARELAERLGIADKLARRPDQLSQGEQQRAAVCRALVTRPGLILADEPTGNLDVANKHRVIEILNEQAREQGASLVTVTHDVELLDHFERVVDLSGLIE
jgi:ABC-type lipoprotein export system ATPase subunit